MRNGIVIGHGYVDELDVTGLQKDDVANLYVGAGSNLVATATYEPTPVINETACIGRTAFNVRRAAGAVVIDAGAYEGVAGGFRSLQSVWTAGESLTVTLERPLQAGDVAYALTSAVIGNVEIQSFRGVPVLDCPLPPQPSAGPPVVAPEIKLTTAGRKLLKRTKSKLKVTLTGTFTPSRAGEAPQRASVSVSLLR